MRHVRASFAFAGSLACPIAPRRTFKALMPDVTIDPARRNDPGSEERPKEVPAAEGGLRFLADRANSHRHAST
jgi:hypothetical protein